MICSSQRTPIQTNISHSKAELSTTLFDKNKSAQISFKDLISRLNSKCHRVHHQPQQNFKPCIHEMPMQVYCEQSKVSREQINQRLIEDSRTKTRERLTIRLLNDKEKQNQCTFHPQVSDFSKCVCNQTNQETFVRLFKEAQERKHEKIQNQLNSKQQPHHKNQQKKKRINYLNEQKLNLKPLYLRVQEVVSRKVKQRKQLAHNLDRQQLTFQPAINKESQRLFNNKFNNEEMKKNVVQRLLADIEIQKKKKEKLQNQQRQKQRKQLTFAPAITNNCTKSNNQTFLQRLKQNIIYRCCKHDQQNMTFTPKINNLSNLITKQERDNENQKQQIDRLVYEQIEKREQNKKIIQYEMYHQYTFNPQINQISSKSQFHKKAHACQIPEQEIYPFRPKINEKSRIIRSRSSQSARNKKQNKQISYRCEVEYQQMKQCTFRPKINSYRHGGCRTLCDVQGIESYMKNTEQAKRKKQLQEKVEEKLFHLEKKYDERMQRERNRKNKKVIEF